MEFFVNIFFKMKFCEVQGFFHSFCGLILIINSANVCLRAAQLNFIVCERQIFKFFHLMSSITFEQRNGKIEKKLRI